MKAYQYNEITGELQGEINCQPSQLERGAFIVPAHATTEKPPKAKSGKKVVFDIQLQAWTQQPIITE